SEATSRVPAFADEAERSAHIAAAGRSERLLTLVAQIRQRRRQLKSVVEHVVDRTKWTDQPTWFQHLTPDGRGQFWWQGDHRIRVDGGAYFFEGQPLQVGSDGRHAWCRIADHFIVGPADAIAGRNVLVCDPLQAGRDQTDGAIVKDLQMEFV